MPVSAESGVLAQLGRTVQASVSNSAQNSWIGAGFTAPEGLSLWWVGRQDVGDVTGERSLLDVKYPG